MLNSSYYNPNQMNPMIVYATRGDLTVDGIKDILISIFSGGSGGMMYYYIYSAVSGRPKLLFDYNVFNQAYQYKVTYKDYYKVDVINVTKGLKYAIDISTRDKDYLDELYDPEGRLKEPREGWVSTLSGLYPIDFDANGVYELLTYQNIAGRYSADSLVYI